VRTRSRSPIKTAFGILITAVMLFPLYWMVNVSLTPNDRLRETNPQLFPLHFTGSGYRKVFHEQGAYLLTSVVIAVGTVVLTLLVAAPAGYAVSKLRLPGRRLLTFLLLIAQMIPSVIIAFGFYAIYLKIDLLNTTWGLIVADSTMAVPFGVLIFAAFMSGISNELLQAAAIDGAGRVRTFLSIVLPISRNAMVTVSLFAFLWSWSDFLFATTLDSQGEHQPITLGIYRYIGNNTQDWNAILATSVVASVPAAFLLVVAQRYVAAGVTAGAVKD
jgi:multiple sugar transport system permease protein